MVSETHLVVFAHGLHGYARNLEYAAQELEKAYGDKITVHMSEVNQGPLMYDGLDICGTRLAQEIFDKRKDIEKEKTCRVTQISFVSFSMGGLVSRFAVGVLDRLGCFEDVQLKNYVTFATPHLGVYRPVHSIFDSFHNATVRYSMNPTGHQMEYVEQLFDGDQPILQLLVNPELEYYKALAKFDTRQIYANSVGDFSVPYFSAAIEQCDYFQRYPDMMISHDTTYPSIVTTFDARSDNGDKKLERRITDPMYAALLMFIIYLPIAICGIFATRRAEDVRRYLRDKNGRWTISKNMPTESSSQTAEPVANNTVSEKIKAGKETNHQEESITNQTCVDLLSTINPKPGRNLVEMTKPLPLHPIQKYGFEQLNKLAWKKVVVHLEHWAHTFIVVTNPRKDNPGGKAVIRHFVDTFNV